MADKVWVEVLQCVRGSYFFVATQIRSSFPSFIGQKAVGNLRAPLRCTQLHPPLKSVWMLWSQCSSSLKLHRHLLSSPPSLRNLFGVRWTWGMRGCTWNAKRGWMHIRRPLRRMLDLQWFIQNRQFLSLFLRSPFFFNPDANYLWVRNSSQLLIKMNTNLSPPLV